MRPSASWRTQVSSLSSCQTSQSPETSFGGFTFLLLLSSSSPSYCFAACCQATRPSRRWGAESAESEPAGDEDRKSFQTDRHLQQIQTFGNLLASLSSACGQKFVDSRTFGVRSQVRWFCSDEAGLCRFSWFNSTWNSWGTCLSCRLVRDQISAASHNATSAWCPHTFGHMENTQIQFSVLVVL